MEMVSLVYYRERGHESTVKHTNKVSLRLVFLPLIRNLVFLNEYIHYLLDSSICLITPLGL